MSRSILQKENVDYVYCLDVEDTHNFFADGYCVHNCQDYNQLQLSLLRHWGKNMKYIMLAGDDDQCLYSWSGSTPDAFLNPPIADKDKRFLRQSRRMPRVIQSFTAQWISQVTRREDKQFSPRDEDGELRRLPASMTYQNVEPILEDAMEQYVNKGKTVMFLASCSYMLDPMKACLKKHGVTYHNPYRVKRGDWNPLHRGRGVSSVDRLLAFLKMDTTVNPDDAAIWSHHDVALWAEVLSAKGVLRHGVKKRLDAMLGDYRQIHLVSMGEVDETIVALDSLLEAEVYDELMWGAKHALDWFDKYLMPAKRAVFEFPMQVVRTGNVKALHETPRVILGTIHSVKGGECDCSYVFPDLSRAGHTEWLTRGEPRDGIVRLFYVACSRSRESLVLCAPSSRMAVTL